MIIELPKILSVLYKTTTFIVTTDAMFSLYTRYMDTSKEELLIANNRQLTNDLRQKDNDLRQKDDDLRQKDAIIYKFIEKDLNRSSWFFWK